MLLRHIRHIRKKLIRKWYALYLDEVYIPFDHNWNFTYKSGGIRVYCNGRMKNGEWFNFTEGYIHTKDKEKREFVRQIVKKELRDKTHPTRK